jgi:heptosyltransferase-3
VSARLDLPARPRILVVALRRLGDVLLTTPLIRSLRTAWPDARIEVLVFADTAQILDGNPDIDGIVTCPERPSLSESLALARQLWRRYDLAITTQAGDRPSFFAIVAGRKRVGVTEARTIGKLKAALLHRHVGMRDDLHRVEETLLLADLLGIARVPQTVPPRATDIARRPQPYAVLHASPFFRYKQWHADGWRALARFLSERGLQVIATGGPGERERNYLDEVWNQAPGVERLDGRLSWPALTCLLTDAQIFIGPDTSVTHLAAASGCPTVALFGPTDPRRWGPWPLEGLREPWQQSQAVQRRGRVWLVQNPLPGMPCGLEGCLRHVGSHSLCLDQMPVGVVLGAVQEALAEHSLEGGAAPKTSLFSPPTPSIADRN